MKFVISLTQFDKVAKWIDEQDEIVRKEQSKNPPEGSLGNLPYYGAIGGEVTYSFTLTSLGMILKVKHGFTGNEIDLTEYELW